jgi:hypothetical protein
MTFDDIKQALLNSELKECNDKMGKYFCSKLFVAYNDKEAWTFHMVRWGSRDIFAVTKVLPHFIADVKDIPPYVFTDLVLDWGDNICAKYGDVTAAMKVYKKE